MVFNSFEYFLFLPVVWLLFNFIGQNQRWLFLLIASYVFYASLKIPYLLGVIVLVTVVTYCFGRWLHRAEEGARKRTLLWLGIGCNLLILVVLKYIPFLAENMNALLFFFDSPVRIEHVPVFVAIGTSYFIFQAISYLSDIYLEIEEPEDHFGYFALYLAFFPKLLQGPIERAGDLLPQLRQKYSFCYETVRFGLVLFAWGLFKKVVLADRLGIYVDTVYDDVEIYKGLPLILATYAYAFQIYFDFSGYTDMALGTAGLFGIRLTDNFNSPYLATSTADFWRRWHISFSRWILDYIFKPLQMKWREWKNWGSAIALVITFLVSGIWHGASWGFVVWGLLHGLYMASSVFYRPWQKKIHKALGVEKTRKLKCWQIFVTFNMVCFAWIFFRGNNFSDILYILQHLFVFDGNPKIIQKLLAGIVLAMLMISVDAFFKNRDFSPIFKRGGAVRWIFYYAVVLLVFLYGMFGASKFIYFQF